MSTSKLPLSEKRAHVLAAEKARQAVARNNPEAQARIAYTAVIAEAQAAAEEAARRAALAAGTQAVQAVKSSGKSAAKSRPRRKSDQRSLEEEVALPRGTRRPEEKGHRWADRAKSGERFGIWLHEADRPLYAPAKSAFMRENNLSRCSDIQMLRMLLFLPTIQIAEEDVALFERAQYVLSNGPAKLTRAATLHRLLHMAVFLLEPDPDREDGRTDRQRLAHIEELLKIVPDKILYAEAERRTRRALTPGVGAVRAMMEAQELAQAAMSEAASDPAATLSKKAMKAMERRIAREADQTARSAKLAREGTRKMVRAQLQAERQAEHAERTGGGAEDASADVTADVTDDEVDAVMNMRERLEALPVAPPPTGDGPAIVRAHPVPDLRHLLRTEGEYATPCRRPKWRGS